MARVQIVKGASSLIRIVDRVSRLPMRDLVAAWRSVIADEFASQSWNSPSGGRRSWERTKVFGTRPAPTRTLDATGALRAAWAGRGAGAIFRVSGDRAEFGVAGSVFPGASTLRGGAGDQISTAPIRIVVTNARRSFLRHRFGVYIKKKFTTHKPRPHATVNPEVRTRLTTIVSAHIAGRQFPTALTTIR